MKNCTTCDKRSASILYEGEGVCFKCWILKTPNLLLLILGIGSISIGLCLL